MTYGLIILSITLLTCSALFAQPGDFPPNAQPGKCYAKCLLQKFAPISADTTFSTYFRYIGSEDVNLSIKYHAVRIDGNGDVKERIPVEVPKKRRKLPPSDLLLDTMYTYHAALIGQSGGFTEWREIVCGSDLSPRLVQQIADQLSNNGFQVNGVHEVLSSEVKAALLKYQRENELPVGQLDFETLDALGVDY